MPRDMVREATTVMNAVNPRPYFDFTRSILPVGAGTITVHMYLVYKVQYTTAKILPKMENLRAFNFHRVAKWQYM